MHRLALATLPALITTLLTASACGQVKPSAAIPATAPTQTTQVSDLPSAHPAFTSGGASAHVQWNGSVLTIQGNGDSLRNILMDVSQATGMKVTGGVPEEPVFGSYGPGAAQDVVPQLFDGIAINVMLSNDGAIQPKELVLTPRNGAATPPQVRAISDDEQQRGRGRRNGFGAPQANQGPGQRPNQPPTAPGATAPPADAAATPAAAVNGSDQPQSPNGVRTPEQIFEELRKRQQQQNGSTAQ